LFARLCSNLAAYTIAHDEASDFGAPNLKEEETVAQILVYEMMRVYGDRVHRASQRTQLMQKLVECCRQEFVGKTSISPQYIDSLVLGNFHKRREGAFVKLSLVTKEEAKAVKDHIVSKLREQSNNQLLEGILNAPHIVREVFKLSRLLFKEMQHAILVGPAGCGKTEYLQLAAILNDALVLELNCERLCEPLKFAQVLKQAVVSAVGLNKNSFILISDAQLRDPIYIDYLHNFLKNMCNKYESTVLWGDQEFRKSIIDIEKQIYAKQEAKRASEPSDD